MTYTDADSELIRLTQLQINTGATRIKLPRHLVEQVSNEVIVEIRRLCKLNGVTVELKM
ncbi:MAG: hypothetical protein PCFJNLEI_01742 [Verrucomicrobiae bacterium]|nr:hypothetical protein [Verrucomicrobiae bacterium]